MSDLTVSLALLEQRQQEAREREAKIDRQVSDIMFLVDNHRNLRWTVISQLNESRATVENAIRAALEKK